MSGKIRKSNDKKNQLVEIAERLFLDKGYEETTVEDILKASGLSKGGFYHYFKSKEEVLTESINIFAEGLLKEFESILEDPRQNALEKLNMLLEKKAASQKPKRELIKYLCMLTKSDFTLYKYCLTIAQKYVEPFAQIIDQGVKEGIFHVEFPQETADILLRAVTSVPQSIFFNEYMDDNAKSLNYKASLMAIMTRALGIESNKIKMF